jgi:hypothetical protein
MRPAVGGNLEHVGIDITFGIVVQALDAAFAVIINRTKNSFVCSNHGDTPCCQRGTKPLGGLNALEAAVAIAKANRQRGKAGMQYSSYCFLIGKVR